MSRRILIIDDEEDIREVVQLSLQVSGGWEVFTAASGEEGIALAIKEQPDVILLDVMMPVLDGMATLKRLQSQSETQKIPVIFLTAKVTSQDAENSIYKQPGVWAIFPKLFDPLTFGQQIVDVLNKN